MMDECMHQSKDCIDSRVRGGYRYRRYSCKTCDAKINSVEIYFEDGCKPIKPEPLTQLITNHRGISEKQLDAIYGLIKSFLPYGADNGQVPPSS